MSDTYQPIYDAIRSRVSQVNIGQIVTEALQGIDEPIRRAGDSMADNFAAVCDAMRRPSVLYRPNLSIDGNVWCALYGSDLQDGVAGFGDSIEAAMADFDREWSAKLSTVTKEPSHA
jgi:hypothetical protein